MIYRNVLVVHRGRTSLKRLSHTLENVGHKVSVASSAKDAMQALKKTRPHIIIAGDDLKEPDVYEFCRRLKKEPPSDTNGVKVMIVAKRETKKAHEKAIECGADDYVAEPFTLPALLERVNIILSRSAPSAATQQTELSGPIAQSGLIDILQLLEFSAKSGVLTVTAGIRHGTMTFSEGRLIAARMDEKRDEAAVYEMLSWEEGEFKFQTQDIPGENGALASISSLVLEWARTKDEKSRSSAPAPPKEQEEKENHEEIEEVPYDPRNWASELNAWLGYLREKSKD